jgi:glycosyltransferase involved in cell wall biosynthesis
MAFGSIVSAIIIFLDAETFIQKAIESVLAQTYGNWELLLVDDGSTDGSTEIAQRYVEQHPGQVRYLEHPDHQNRHMSASRNLGISQAKGQYIAFLDADDVWLPHKLEQQVAILDSHPEAGMVYGRFLYYYSWTGKPEDSQRDFFPRLGVEPDTLIGSPTLLMLFLQRKAAVPCVSDFMVRREIAERVGGFEADFCVLTRGMYEDQVFYAKVCLKTPVFATDECWCKYRRHPGSACAIERQTGLYHSSRLTYLSWLAKHLSEQGFKGSDVWEVLQHELWVYQHPRQSRLRQRIQSVISGAKRLVKRHRLAEWIYG